MAVATISFDDPNGRQIDVPVRSRSDVRSTLMDLQRMYPRLNFLADVTAPDRVRMSVVLAQDQGAAIVWTDPVVRTQSTASSHSQIPVWDGAGIEMPAKYFVPLAYLIPVVEEWISAGTLSRAVAWTSEDYNT